VFFGGMRGTAFVNTFQTVLFLSFGAIALVVIGRGIGGFGAAMESLLASPSTAPLLTRERISPWYYFSYTFIPLSTIAFPHITIFCLTAKRMVQFKRTVIFYPICLLAIWLPCVFLGVVANSLREVPQIGQKLEARAAMAALPADAPAEARNALRRQAAGDDVVLVMLETFAPLWLAGILGAGIMAAVMASDSQILALSTMFTEDVFAFYGGTARFGENVQVQTGRLFVVLLTVVAYVIALRAPQGIFDLAVQYAFSGYAALSPLLVAALFWKRSTKWGALAVAVWVAGAVIYTARVPGALAWYGLLPVVPMTLISSALMIGVSLVTRPPSSATVQRYA
jgi:SSS family solute:Na+ symporter